MDGGVSLGSRAVCLERSWVRGPCLQEGVCLGERAQSRCETRGLVGEGVCLRELGSARGRALARVSGARVFMCGAAGTRGRGARSCSAAALSSPSVRGPSSLARQPGSPARRPQPGSAPTVQAKCTPVQRRPLCFPCVQGKLRGKVWKNLLRAWLTCSPEAGCVCVGGVLLHSPHPPGAPLALLISP